MALVTVTVLLFAAEGYPEDRLEELETRLLVALDEALEEYRGEVDFRIVRRSTGEP